MEIGNVNKDKLIIKYFDKKFLYIIGCDEDFEIILILLEWWKMFVWRYGIVEDVILSFRNCYEEICLFINCFLLINKSLKKKLKEWFDEKERRMFYS